MADAETSSKNAPGTEESRKRRRTRLPMVIYVLGLTILSVTTSEFMVAGMMASLSAAFDVSVAEIGYLISIYAASMVVGGPLLTVVLLKLKAPNKQALLSLLAIYAVGGVIAAMAPNYGIMAMARVVTGVAGSACFGVSLAICADLVGPESRGRAASIVIAGLMFATVLGVPAATLIDQHYGWRASFWLVVAMTVVCGVISSILVPASRKVQETSLGAEFAAFRNRHLWAAFASSALIIGATFAAFSYFSPIFTDVTGFSEGSVPVLLVIYGVANVVGNTIVGHYADKYTMPILVIGLMTLFATLVMFAFFADNRIIAVTAFVVIGLVGVPMNPAMIARVMKTANAGPLINTVHTSVINIGLGVGTWLGGMGIVSGYGLRSPLWVGAALAFIGLLSLAPAGARWLSSQDAG